jgi:ubiquinone/menaquinone biosynthesis C-methylase UbiE
MKDTEPREYSPVDRPLSRAAAYYSLLAPWYDILAGSEKRYIRQGLTLLDPKPGEWVLEIGFGTGYAQKRIIPILKDGFSAGVDLSTGMARSAQLKLGRAGLSAYAGLTISDSLPLPFPENTFDALFSSFTLELFDTPQIPILLGEFRRVLKRGGRLVVVSLSKDQPPGTMGRLYETFHNHFPTLADCRPIPIRKILEENGFEVARFEDLKMWGLPVSLAKGLRRDSLEGITASGSLIK